MVATTDVVMEHAEIVKRDVRKLRTPRNLAESPYTFCGRFKPLVDLYVSTIGHFDTGQLESDICCVRRAACCDEQMTAFELFFRAVLFNNDFDCLTGLSRYRFDLCIENKADT